MDPILPNFLPPAPSAARGPAEQGEKSGSPDTAHSGENRFESILKRTAAGLEGPAKGRPAAQGGRRASIAGKEAEADTSTPPSVSAAVWGSVAPTAPDDAVSAKTDPTPVLAGAASLSAGGDPLLNPLPSGSQPAAVDGEENAVPAQAPVAGGVDAVPAPPTAAASEPKNADSARVDPAPVLAGAATLAAEGDPLLKPLSSGNQPAATDGEENAAPAQAPGGGVVDAVPAPPTAAASVPKNAGSARVDPAPVLAGAATLAAEGDPLLKPLSSGNQPAATDGEENAASVQAPGAGGVDAVPAPPTAAASVPKNAGSARVDGTPVGYRNTDPAPEGTVGVEGIRKKKDDAFARIEGQAEPASTPSADGNLGIAERPAPPRPVGPASDPIVVRFEEKAFIITRKSDTSVEVTLAPPGVGKLEIEVVLEKGVVNARILAADAAGREAIARSLPQIMEALARDGMNVGGFTVSLKERRDRTGGSPGHGASRDPDARLLSVAAPAASASAPSAGLVNIFV